MRHSKVEQSNHGRTCKGVHRENKYPQYQYVMVRHHDAPHMHIIKACKEITLKHGYHLVKGKKQINHQALNGKEKLRCELFDANRYMLLFLE